MAEINFNAAIKQWLIRISRSENPPSEIVAYNIGLFQTETGYRAYLSGATSFSDEDSDWACDETFTPSERYFAFPRDLSNVDWDRALAVTVDAVKDFLAENPASFLNTAKAVTVRFDDGDLERVK